MDLMNRAISILSRAVTPAQAMPTLLPLPPSPWKVRSLPHLPIKVPTIVTLEKPLRVKLERLEKVLRCLL